MNVAGLYPWIKALHVVAVLLFVSGMILSALALWALGNTEGRPSLGTLRLARRWDTRVTTTAMLATWGFGLALAISGGWFASGWLAAKLVLVVILSGLHGVLSGRLRVASGGGSIKVFELAPAFVIATAAAIAILAVVKPA